MSDGQRDTKRLDIDWVKTAAAALAAVSSAVVLSTLGSAGTILGAAVGSVVASVGTSLYSQGIARSKESMARAQESALERIGLAQAEVRRARRGGADTPTGRVRLEQAEAELAAAEGELAEPADTAAPQLAPTAPPAPGWRARLAGLPWRRVAVFAAATFMIVLVAITAFELLWGRSISSYIGDDDRRTTIIGGTHDSDGDRQDREPDQPGTTPSEEVSPSATPPNSKASSESATPTESGEPTTEPTTPADEPSDGETTAPGEEPSVPATDGALGPTG